MERLLSLLRSLTDTQMPWVVALVGVAAAVLGLAAVLLGRRRAAQQRLMQQALDLRMRELGHSHAELQGSLRMMAENLASRQSELARLVADRLDSVGARLGQGLEQSSRTAHEDLVKLNERLAVIDAAQARLTDLTEEVIGLKDILANKQARGAFGQGRMEAIIRDVLPPSAFTFQHNLSNRSRPDCVIRLPNDERLLVVDAKFPLEGFVSFREAQTAEARKQAGARVRADVGKHIRDIAERYFIPGETQDLAILFVPAESLYADLLEHFEDVMQKAHQQRIIIVSPSLLVMAVQILQALVRDARIREQAHAIQTEVRLLVDDVLRLQERVGKLSTHFRQAQDDIAQILTSADKIGRRGERIELMDFETSVAADPPIANTSIKAAE